MNNFPAPPEITRLPFICGAQELENFSRCGITHLLSIANPGAVPSKPSWFRGAHLQLWFGDVFSEEDAKKFNTKAPTIEDIRLALSFFREAWQQSHSRILFSCDYGASRSPALAYVCLADQFGAGGEDKAFACVLAVRPNAVPNSMVVRLGDVELGRNKVLLKPLRELNAKISRELSR